MSSIAFIDIEDINTLYRKKQDATLDDLRRAFETLNGIYGRSEIFVSVPDLSFVIGVDLDNKHFYIRLHGNKYSHLYLPHVKANFPEVFDEATAEALEFIANNGQQEESPQAACILCRDEAIWVAEYMFEHHSLPPEWEVVNIY